MHLGCNASSALKKNHVSVEQPVCATDEHMAAVWLNTLTHIGSNNSVSGVSRVLFIGRGSTEIRCVSITEL